MGSDVADVMAYVGSMPRMRTLTAELGDRAVAGRVLAIMAERYAARRRTDGVWVDAAAWLVTARRRGWPQADNPMDAERLTRGGTPAPAVRHGRSKPGLW